MKNTNKAILVVGSENSKNIGDLYGFLTKKLGDNTIVTIVPPTISAGTFSTPAGLIKTVKTLTKLENGEKTRIFIAGKLTPVALNEAEVRKLAFNHLLKKRGLGWTPNYYGLVNKTARF